MLPATFQNHKSRQTIVQLNSSRSRSYVCIPWLTIRLTPDLDFQLFRENLFYLSTIETNWLFKKHLKKKNTILVNLGCYNKAPLTSWFTSNRNLFLTVLQTGSPRSRYQYDHVLMSDLLSSTEGHLLALSLYNGKSS